MATKLSVSRTQWAVGNGFFHSGAVSTSAKTVNYVYDCGALASNDQALAREVNAFATRTATVDFMFISHFDFDHVSGIPRLTSSVAISRFIIPLIPTSERLFILAANLADGSVDDSDSASFYQDFIIDPVGTLSALTANLAVPAAIQVVPPRVLPEPRESTVPELLPRDEISGASRDEDISLGYSSVRVRARAPRTVWEWRHFVARQAKEATTPFIDALIAMKLIARRRDLRDHKVVSDLVKNHGAELASAYDKAIKSVGKSYNRNLTSLMMYSGPPAGSRYRAFRTRGEFVERAEIGAWNPRPAWLGFGDANLRSAHRRNEVSNAFHDHKPYVGTFAPSHHGALPDWHESLMSGFDPNNEYPPTYVFGASGNYRSRKDKQILHPSGDVVLAINESGGTAVLVGRTESSRWTESLSVFVAR